MKKVILILAIMCLIGGCGGNKSVSPTNTGVITISYEKPVDFKQFEVNISTTAGVNPTGWNGTKWASQPNAPVEWNGVDKTLFLITTTDPIQVTGLTPGVTYFYKVVVVDKSNMRSIPSPEGTAVAGDAQRSSTLVVAASDASPASKAGADYICDGVSDQETINGAINAAVAQNSGAVVTIKGTEGTYIIDGSIVTNSNVTLDIPGTIKLKNGITGAFTAIKNSDQINGNNNITIKSLNIDGNQANNNLDLGSYGIALNKCTNVDIKDIIVKDLKGISVYTKSSSKVTITAIKVNNCVRGVQGDGLIDSNITKCILSGNSQYGVWLYDSCENVILSNNNCISNGIRGIFVSSSKKIVVNGNAVSSNSGNGIYIYETTDSNIGNNSCNNNGECGIEFAYCSDCSINGNNASANGANMDNFYANINLSGDGTKNSIQNNVCRKGSGTQKPKYGISISQSAITYTLIANNDCYEGGVTRGIYDLGTNTTFGQNRNNDGTWSTTPN